MNFTRDCLELNEHFNAPCDCAKHSLQLGTLSESSGDSLLITVGVDLVDDATPMSFIAAISTAFLLS